MALAAFLILIARPVAVWICLFAFRFTRHEMAFVSWVGLRGAVSILLAILPVIAGLPQAQNLFNAVFIIVLVSLLIQGWTIAPVARFLGLRVPPRHGPVDRIELELPGRGDHEIVAYVVHPESAVGKGQRIPRWARPALIVRDGRSLRPDVAGRPQAGDYVYVITAPNYIALLDGLFAGPVEGTDDPRLYGEFPLNPDTRLADLSKVYDVPVVDGDAELTIAELIRRDLDGDIEQGDRIAYGPVDFIARKVDEEHEILEVGLALEHGRQKRAHIPLFHSPREVADLWRDWRARRRNKRAAATPEAPPSEAVPDVDGEKEIGERKGDEPQGADDNQGGVEKLAEEELGKGPVRDAPEA